jgi:hypothetical protein
MVIGETSSELKDISTLADIPLIFEIIPKMGFTGL